MAAAEIERCLAGRPLVNVANRAALASPGAPSPWSGDLHPRDRPRHRQLPGRRLRPGRHAGGHRPARVVARRAARRSRLAGLRHEPQLGAHLRLRRRGDRPGGVGPDAIAGVSSTSMREGIVLYDAAGREIWACPNVDSRAAGGGRPSWSERRRAADLRAGRRLGVDHLARPIALDPRARARDLRRDRPRRHAQRLGPVPADRAVRHRSVIGLELGHVRPRGRGPGRRSRSGWSACRRPDRPRGPRAGHGGRSSHRCARPRRRGSRPARPSSSAARTPSSGSSASAS